MVEAGPGDPGEDEGLTLRGEHRGDERPRAPEVGPRQRRDRRPHLPQGRRHQERPPAHGPRRLRALARTPTSASARTCCCAGRSPCRQYLEASRLIAPGRRLGTILVELGALEPEDLIGAIEHHVKEILLDVFTWTHGRVRAGDDRARQGRRHRPQPLHREPDPRGHPPHARLEPDLPRDRGRHRLGADAHRQHGGAAADRADRGGAGGPRPRQRARHDRADLPGVLPLQPRDLPRALGPDACSGWCAGASPERRPPARRGSRAASRSSTSRASSSASTR